MWDFLSELRSSVCEKRLEKTVLTPKLLPVKIAQFTQVFRHVLSHTRKTLSLTESVNVASKVLKSVKQHLAMLGLLFETKITVKLGAMLLNL